MLRTWFKWICQARRRAAELLPFFRTRLSLRRPPAGSEANCSSEKKKKSIKTFSAASSTSRFSRSGEGDHHVRESLIFRPEPFQFSRSAVTHSELHLQVLRCV